MDDQHFIISLSSFTDDGIGGSVNEKGVIVTLHNEQSTPLSPVHLGGYDTIMEFFYIPSFYICLMDFCVSYCIINQWFVHVVIDSMIR